MLALGLHRLLDELLLQLRLAEHHPDPLLVDALGDLGRLLDMDEMYSMSTSQSARLASLPVPAASGDFYDRPIELLEDERVERRLEGVSTPAACSSSFIRAALGGVGLKQFARVSEVVEVRGNLAKLNRRRIPIGL